MKRRHSVLVLLGAAASLMSACSTVPDPYVPARMGAFQAGQPSDGLVLEIHADDTVAALGEPLTFKVIIRNMSDQAYWIPRKPQLLFYWIYPTGQRDNYVIEFSQEQYYSLEDAVLLQPGEQVAVLERIETFYFPKGGITEFKAKFFSARNTNKQLAPFWHGTIFSNNFGVMLRARNTSALDRATTEQDIARRES